MGTVSVIIPTYNRARYISEAIESVLDQQPFGHELEVIVIDDGSTDNTAEIVKKYSRSIRYVRQENRGAGAARNRGILEAKGQWIAFLDSDDRWLPYKLALQFQVLAAFPQCHIIHSNFYTFNDIDNTKIIEDGLDYWVSCHPSKFCLGIWRQDYSYSIQASALGIQIADFIQNIPENDFRIYIGNIFPALLYHPAVACWTLLIDKRYLNSETIFSEHYPTWEDAWFFLRLCENHDVIFIDFPTAENRAHTSSRLTQAKRSKTLECHLDICEKLFLPSRSPHRPSTAKIEQECNYLRIQLFKEYLKEGQRSKALDLIGSFQNRKRFENDFTFYLYRLASRLPFNIVSHLVQLKRLFIKE